MDNYHQIQTRQEKVKKWSTRFTILNNVRYKRGFSLPYLRCIEQDKARWILDEVHEGICGDHSGARSLVRKIIRVGYFWSTIQKEAKEFVRRCDKCQRYKNVQQVSREKMTTITSPWPLAQWEINIVGPLPPCKKKVNFLLRAFNYFTKWVEVEALVTITKAKI